MAAGTYQLTAVARDNDGATTNVGGGVGDRQLGDQPGAIGLADLACGGRLVHRAGERHADQASASDTDGTVTRVEFYRGTTLIGSDTTSPYSAVWTGAAAGSYSLTAIAVDDDGATRTSTAVGHHRHGSTQSVADGLDHQSDRRAVVYGAGFADDHGHGERHRRHDRRGRLLRRDAAHRDGHDESLHRGVDQRRRRQLLADRRRARQRRRHADVGGRRGDGHRRLRPDRDGRLRRLGRSRDQRHVVHRGALSLGADPVTATPVATRDIGKPTPVSGDISVNISTLVDPLPAGSYYAVVRASGPGGTTASAPSATFTK